MKKLILFITTLILIPLVKAEECGLLNLASCIPEKIYSFILEMMNASIYPLLSLTQSLLTEPVKISLFSSLWAIILYVISLFYGILMLYSGFNFMFSGYDAIKRAKAKEWFMNIFIMIILIQASYFLYELILNVERLLTSGVINLIEDNFFMITADNKVNLGLQFFFIIFYAGTLLITVLFLTIRYIVVIIGIVFLPIGIFCYFIPPLSTYGKLILNFLGVCIFITFFDALIFLVCSQLVQINLFENFKILVMISAFSLANFLMFFLMLFSAIKSAIKTTEKTTGTIVAVAKYFA